MHGKILVELRIWADVMEMTAWHIALLYKPLSLNILSKISSMHELEPLRPATTFWDQTKYSWILK